MQTERRITLLSPNQVSSVATMKQMENWNINLSIENSKKPFSKPYIKKTTGQKNTLVSALAR